MNSIRVALINPGPLEGVKSQEMLQISPPLGLLYLSAVLKAENYHVDLLDLVAYQYNATQVMKWIKQKDPDIVGFSTLIIPSSCVSAAVMAKEIKSWNPNIKIVFGNKHATYNDVRILKKYPFIDVCVRNEGEYTFLELINTIVKGQPLKSVRGITYSSNGNIIRNDDRALIRNLDELPFPDRKSLKYNYKMKFGLLDLAPYGFSSILASRGCPHNCSYCYGRDYMSYRMRSPENIIDELELLENENYRMVNFVDDNFTVNKKWGGKICALMKKRKIDIDWVCEGRVDQVSLELLSSFRRSNCRAIFYGIESANQETLNYFNKKTTPAQAELAVDKARRARIPFIIGSFILGAPNERIQDIRNTLKFTWKLDIDFPFINLLFTSPGTGIWKDLVDKQLLDEEKYWEGGVQVLDIISKAGSKNRIIGLMQQTLREFFVRKDFIFKQIFRFFSNSYKLHAAIKVATSNIQNFRNFRGAGSFMMAKKAVNQPGEDSKTHM